MTAATGTSGDIQSRVLRILPKGWFQWTASIRDALLGGISDQASWCYGLIGYAKAQTRLATAYGVWLDILAYDFLGLNLPRQGPIDDSYRALIKSTILQERVTRAGMINAVTKLTGLAPAIFEPWNTFDTGGYSNARFGQMCGQFGYGVGQGGYGNMNLPGQVLMQVHRLASSGVPNASGYDQSAGGYGVGGIEYVGSTTQLEGITDGDIYNLINVTKPTGSIVWVAFTTPAQNITTESGIDLSDDSGDPLTTK